MLTTDNQKIKIKQGALKKGRFTDTFFMLKELYNKHYKMTQ